VASVIKPGSRTAGAGKKHNIKIQKQDIQNINKLYNRKQENTEILQQVNLADDINQPPTNIEDIRESLFGT